MDDETIAALSTPPGRGGIAVIRISGQRTQHILREIVENLPEEITPRRAYHSFIVEKGKRIDECLVVFFKAPHSYTGEDLAEISIHANPFIIEAVLELILEIHARSALAGEFTYRAFKNGKIDLIQAESVNELINANSRYYATMKFGSLEGKLSQLFDKIKDNLVQLGIKIETRIEFEEDQYLGEISIAEELQDTKKNLDQVLANSRYNEILNKGLNVVIVGKVNVGKSSLFNTLLMEDRAITSAIPGTTRDFLKEKLYIDGLPVEITDAAGINQQTRDEIEAAGIRRSLEKIDKSDAVIFMLDASQECSREDQEIYNLIKQKRKIVTANKIDIVNPRALAGIKARFPAEQILEISVTESINIEKVRTFLKTLVNDVTDRGLDLTVNQRQKQHLERLQEALLNIEQMVKTRSNSLEIIAEEIRQALHIIGQLMGEITPEDILHGIFSQFCVGK